MANNRCTYQQQNNVSIPKKALVDYIATNASLSKKDLRVALVLFTELDGWCEPEKSIGVDPKNFKKIDVEKIAEVLDMKEKDVKASIKLLENELIIERGSSNVTNKGYRFTF